MKKQSVSAPARLQDLTTSSAQFEQSNTPTNGLLKLPDVEKRVLLSRSTIYKKVANRTFPKPIKLSERASAWRESDINEWIANLATDSEVAA